MNPDMIDAPGPGFADAVHDSQRAFRALLDAIARPGSVVRVEAAMTPPEGLSAAAAAALLTLVDFETPLWIDAAGRTPALLAWTRFHCGAPIVDDPAGARFALVTDPAAMPPLDRFAVGEDAYPDRSATVIVETAGLRTGEGFRLTGPGIAHAALLAADGLPAGFARQWRANRALFPCGVDLFLTAGDRVAALPRTTEMEG